jgi:hypothetical protein
VVRPEAACLYAQHYFAGYYGRHILSMPLMARTLKPRPVMVSGFFV